MTVYPPNDDVVGPIAHQLVLIAQSQLTGIDYFYEYETDGAPQHNSLMVMEPKFDITDDSDGRYFIILKFTIVLRYSTSQTSIDLAPMRQYVTPMLQAYGSWLNSDLGGLCRIVSIKSGGIVRELYAGEPFRSLVLNIAIETEYNIPTS